MKLFSANKSFLGRYDRMLAAYAVTLLVMMCGLVGFSAATGAAGNGVDEAQMVLDNMLRAQENLTSFELPATARVYLGGRNVLTANVQVLASRPQQPCSQMARRDHSSQEGHNIHRPSSIRV